MAEAIIGAPVKIELSIGDIVPESVFKWLQEFMEHNPEQRQALMLDEKETALKVLNYSGFHIGETVLCKNLFLPHYSGDSSHSPYKNALNYSLLKHLVISDAFMHRNIIDTPEAYVKISEVLDSGEHRFLLNCQVSNLLKINKEAIITLFGNKTFEVKENKNIVVIDNSKAMFNESISTGNYKLIKVCYTIKDNVKKYSAIIMSNIGCLYLLPLNNSYEFFYGNINYE